MYRRRAGSLVLTGNCCCDTDSRRYRRAESQASCIMAGARVKAFAILCMVALCLHMADAQVRGLRVNYYQRSCPRAEQIIRTAVQNGFNSDPTIPAGLIRMLFHDCFVRVSPPSLYRGKFHSQPQREYSPHPKLFSVSSSELAASKSLRFLV